MPGGNWRWGVVAVVAWSAQVASAQDSTRINLPGPAGQPGFASVGSPQLYVGAADPKAPAAGAHGDGHGDHEPKDLTPKLGWPPPENHPPEAPHLGHLAPSAPVDGGLFGSAEYLLLRARRGGFDYAVADPSRDLATTGALQYLNYELRSGVRGTIGYRLPDCGWELASTYTYYRTSADMFSAATPGGSLLPTLTRPGLVNEVATAAADANLEYNVFDAELARRFAVDDHFSVRLGGGVRFATIRQDLAVSYDGLDARQARVSQEQAFDAFGPMLSAETVFVGYRGFHLYARATGALVTGKSRNPFTETNGGGATVYTNLDNETRKVVPVAGLGIGAGWQYRTVAIRVGYEVTHWFGLIDQLRATDAVSPGKLVSQPADLSLEGLFVQLGVAF